MTTSMAIIRTVQTIHDIETNDRPTRHATVPKLTMRAVAAEHGVRDVSAVESGRSGNRLSAVASMPNQAANAIGCMFTV